MPWYHGGFTGISSRDVAVSLKSETTATTRSRMLHQSTKQIQSELDKFLKKTFVGYCNPFHVNNPCLCFLCCCQVVGDVSKCEAVTSSNVFFLNREHFLLIISRNIIFPHFSDPHLRIVTTKVHHQRSILCTCLETILCGLAIGLAKGNSWVDNSDQKTESEGNLKPC